MRSDTDNRNDQAHRARTIGGARQRAAAVALGFVALVSAGCQQPFASRGHGLTVYLDGAGHWGEGGDTVHRGLAAAGYRGDFREFVWTTSYNPLIDQWNTPAAKRQAEALSKRIAEFCRTHPSESVNVIAHSAGTGVAIWAVEALPPDVAVNNLVFLGSSLSYDYDASKALSRMTGNIFVYHSTHDTVLHKVEVIGTIDGQRGVPSAGLVGLSVPPGQAGRVINVSWSRQWLRYGWTGAHADATNSQFARVAIARHLMAPSATDEAQLASGDAEKQEEARAARAAQLVSMDTETDSSSRTAG